MLPLYSSPVDIVVLGNGSLFDEGVSSLLIGNSQLNVSRILYTDDTVLFKLVNFDRPKVVFLNEFDPPETDRIVRLIFSIPSVFVRCVVVAHLENNVFDIYNRPAENVLSNLSLAAYQWHSVTVRSKEELINLARSVSV